ncbi:2Fe-2S iron-sulfur cluster-binding protein [Caloranaerobacter ferrireducens]|uniref:2Fe-2S iron-sulfur cluster-binding protein n=1 Tax=Caloranaerobacter ferrireducens TaxID=1323370 RepID=UPI00084D817B|nr:2Fe-2S iron-sulfur cluster-binding protein [Caloranaerobacter ferrireducens]
MKNITLIIDGRKVTVPENYTIIQAAEKLGIEIPALCYDPNLEVVSSCRLCVVEIEGNPKLMTSCSTQVAEGMIVYTESERVIKTRKEILQLLLDNHPNDCLTCEKAGECLLQKYAYRYDVKFREHNGEKRKALMDTSSPYILRDESKCILCGKCVRTCAQINERAVLSFANRGFETRIVADANNSLEESRCVSCNRCVAVCPTGALIDRRNMNKVRAWEAEKEIVKCKVCEYGCDFEVLKKNGKAVAVKAKTPGEGRPLCLKGRLWTELVNVEKVDKPYIKENGKFIETDWQKALGLEEITEKIKG